MDAAISQQYGNRVRVRVSGLCWEDDRLLMVNHRGLTTSDFWAPPGGGIEFGETAKDRLCREFLEETGLQVEAQHFLFACEFIHRPLHAIELFFLVNVVGGQLTPGNDPELPIITAVRFMNPDEIATLPEAHLHGVFRLISAPDELRRLTGFFRI